MIYDIPTLRFLLFLPLSLSCSIHSFFQFVPNNNVVYKNSFFNSFLPTLSLSLHSRSQFSILRDITSHSSIVVLLLSPTSIHASSLSLSLSHRYWNGMNCSSTNWNVKMIPDWILHSSRISNNAIQHTLTTTINTQHVI